MKTLSDQSGPSRFQKRVQIQRFPNQLFYFRLQGLGWGIEGRHQVSSYGGTRVRKWRRLHLENFFLTFLEFPRSTARSEKDC